MNEPSYPHRNDVEVPLLQAIHKLGGKIVFSTQGKQLENVLAKALELTEEQKNFSAPNYHSKGNRKWRNEIQFVRNQLVDKGHLDGSQNNVWALTLEGYDRIGEEPHPWALRS